MTFRGKTKSGEWVEGYYIRFSEIYGEHLIFSREVGESGVGLPSGCSGLIDTFTEILPDSLSMSTGLKDKNGKMIFGSIFVNGKMSKGGDVCYAVRKRNSILLEESSDRIYRGKIVFLKGGFKLEWVSDKQNILHVRIGELHELEIIGNQYEGGEV